MLKVFFGRESIDKEKFIIDSLDLGEKAIILVPDQYTLEMERNLFYESKKKAFMDIEVMSISRLGFRLLQKYGGIKRNFIDKYGRHMLLSEIAISNQDKLDVFKGAHEKSSFIELVNNFISEMKQFNCGEKELDEIIDKLDEGYTKKKLSDLALIYKEYEKIIEGRYTDSEDRIDLYIENIKKSQDIRNSEIYVYGFDSFAPKTLLVIGELSKYAKNVNVILTYSEKSQNDKELFSLEEVVIKNLEKLNQDFSKEEISEKYLIDNRDEAISFLEHELYSVPSKSFAGKTEAIKLVRAANIYNEAESAASYALHLIRDEGYRLNDIRVICDDPNLRTPILVRTFKEYGLDLISDAGKSIMSSSLIEYITSLLNVVIDGFRQDDLFVMLKSGFSGLEHDEITDLENYAVKYRIKGQGWNRPFEKGSFEYESKDIERLNGIREKVVSNIKEFEKIFSSKTNSEFIEKLKSYIPDVSSDDIYSQVYDSLIDILDQIDEIIGGEKFRKELFREILGIGLKEAEIGVLPPTKDGLILGTMERSRISKVKAVIVVGANEGILPQSKSPSGLFLDDEIKLFKEKGIELSKVDSVKLLEEKMAIYRNISKPLEKLYVSYSSSDEDGKQIRSSSIFNKLHDIFPEDGIECDILNSNELSALINNKVGGKRHLVQNLQKVKEGERLEEKWQDTIKWYRENEPDVIEMIKRGISFDNKGGSIGNDAAKELYIKDGDEDFSLSPSRLEKFSRCPFSHLVSYGLRPEERRVFETAAREIGDIYHECLMELTTKLTKEKSWDTIRKGEVYNFAEEVVTRRMSSYRDGIFSLGNEEKYKAKRITENCKNVCWAVIEQVRAGEIEDFKFEASFKRGAEIKPIEIEVESGKVYIEGKIDRVDYLKDDRVKIIDYKTGDEKFNVEEARKGYRLQLMLYLKAAKENDKKPAGVFYFHISEPMIDTKGKEMDEEKLQAEIKKSFKMNGVMIDDPDTVKSMAGEFTGYSDIIPAYRYKVGNIKNTDSVLSEEKFTELENDVDSKVKEIAERLTMGEYEAHPMKTRERSACTYCKYHGICLFDTEFDGNSWNVIS